MKRLINRLLTLSLNALGKHLVSLYAAPAGFRRRLLLKPVYLVRRLVFFLQSGMLFDQFLLTGQSARDELPLRVGYLRAGRGMEYLAGQLFLEDRYECVEVGRVPFWRLNSAARDLARQVDLVVIERNTLLSWTPESGTWLTSPCWVRMAAEISPTEDWGAAERSLKKQERNIKRFKRAGFVPRISRSAADFNLFYDQMYLPLISRRHPSTGLIDSKAHLRPYFEDGFLTVIDNGQGEPVAADLDFLIGETLFGIACGVRGGDPDLLDAGALSAVYYFVLRYCHEHSIRRCDIGEVRPIVHDGVYQYKRRWGYQPVPELWNTREWLLWAPAGSTAADWIIHHPFLPEFVKFHARG